MSERPDNTAGLQPGEKLLAEFRADRATYWRRHLILAVVFGAVAGGVLLAMGDANPWVGPVGSVLAIGARALYLASEAMGQGWRLTARRLIGPGGQVVPLSALAKVQPFFGDVQMLTQDGEKHLIKYQADAPAVVAQIDKARSSR